MKLLPQLVVPQMDDKMKIRFAEDKPNRITSDKANVPNEASLATNE